MGISWRWRRDQGGLAGAVDGSAWGWQLQNRRISTRFLSGSVETGTGHTDAESGEAGCRVKVEVVGGNRDGISRTGAILHSIERRNPWRYLRREGITFIRVEVCSFPDQPWPAAGMPKSALPARNQTLPGMLPSFLRGNWRTSSDPWCNGVIVFRGRTWRRSISSNSISGSP